MLDRFRRIDGTVFVVTLGEQGSEGKKNVRVDPKLNYD